MNFSLGYHAIEDRIWIKFTEENLFWITRSLAIRFMKPSFELLEKTVSGHQVPSALPSNQRIRIDHELAMFNIDQTKPGIVVKKNNFLKYGDYKIKSKLVDNIKVTITGFDWVVTIISEIKQFEIKLNRLDMHRFLQGLILCSEKGGWHIECIPDWSKKSNELI